MRVFFALLFAAFMSPVVCWAQGAAPSTVAVRQWSPQGVEPQWRARIDAMEGHSAPRASVLARDADGVVLVVIEYQRGGDTWVASVERRDATGRVVWRHPLVGVPARPQALAVLTVEGNPNPDSILVVAHFIPTDRKPGAPFGSFVEIDRRQGSMRVAGSFPYPVAKRDSDFAILYILRARLLPDGLIALHGGIESGATLWWAGIRRLDGGVVWDAASPNDRGLVVDMRPAGDGFELSTRTLMPPGTYLIRVDGAGTVIGSVELPAGRSAQYFLADGGVIWMSDKDKVLVSEDRGGRRRFAASVPGASSLLECRADGSCLIDRKDDFVLVAPDGKSAIAFNGKPPEVSLLPDDTIFVSQCVTATKCHSRTLSLYARPR